MTTSRQPIPNDPAVLMDFCIECTECGAWNEDDRTTCEECGTQLGDLERCSACGGDSLAIRAVCNHCCIVLTTFTDRRGRTWTAGEDYE